MVTRLPHALRLGCPLLLLVLALRVPALPVTIRLVDAHAPYTRVDEMAWPATPKSPAPVVTWVEVTVDGTLKFDDAPAGGNAPRRVAEITCDLPPGEHRITPLGAIFTVTADEVTTGDPRLAVRAGALEVRCVPVVFDATDPLHTRVLGADLQWYAGGAQVVLQRHRSSIYGLVRPTPLVVWMPVGVYSSTCHHQFAVSLAGVKAELPPGQTCSSTDHLHVHGRRVTVVQYPLEVGFRMRPRRFDYDTPGFIVYDGPSSAWLSWGNGLNMGEGWSRCWLDFNLHWTGMWNYPSLDGTKTGGQQGLSLDSAARPFHSLLFYTKDKRWTTPRRVVLSAPRTWGQPGETLEMQADYYAPLDQPTPPTVRRWTAALRPAAGEAIPVKVTQTEKLLALTLPAAPAGAYRLQVTADTGEPLPYQAPLTAELPFTLYHGDPPFGTVLDGWPYPIPPAYASWFTEVK
jgi:hypothetical protein